MRARFIVVVAVAVVFPQLQCAAACASQLCGTDNSRSGSLPPCHRHHDYSHNRAPARCPHHMITAPAISPQAVRVEAPVFPVVGLAAPAPAVYPAGAQTSAYDSLSSSPPASGSLSVVVLRI
jgi:hypothetical protein